MSRGRNEECGIIVESVWLCAHQTNRRESVRITGAGGGFELKVNLGAWGTIAINFGACRDSSLLSDVLGVVGDLVINDGNVIIQFTSQTLRSERDPLDDSGQDSFHQPMECQLNAQLFEQKSWEMPSTPRFRTSSIC